MNLPTEPDVLARVLSSPDVETSFHYLAAVQYASTLAIVADPNRGGDAARLAEAIAARSYDLARQADERLGGPIERRGHHCRPGCFFCCWLPIDVLAHEALAIATRLRETLDPPMLAQTIQRVGEAEQKVSDMSSEDCIRAKVPCPLLELKSGTCQVYDVRPHACRQYASFEREACESALGDPDAAVPTDFLSQTVHSRVMMGVAVAFHELGLDHHTLDLASALHIALTEPEAARRWLAGEDLFAPAWRGRREPEDVDPTEDEMDALRRQFQAMLTPSKKSSVTAS